MGFVWKAKEQMQQSPFLRLPTEIRAQILRYLLPYSLSLQDNHEVTWVRGSIAPLLINKELYDEALDLLYGSNTFKTIVTYEVICFRFSWLLPSGLRPNSTLHFPLCFSADAMKRIRHILIMVEQVDSYQGMIKYNCGGRGLNEGVRTQISRLVDALRTNEYGLGRVIIRLEGNAVLEAIRKRNVRAIEKKHSGGVDQSVLQPFASLRRVGSSCVGGNIDTAYSSELERTMMCLTE